MTRLQLRVTTMRDSEIEQWVLRHLRLLELPDSREVCILSRKGIVTLNGTVANQMSKLAMHGAARNVRGVIAVINNLQSEATEAAVPRFVPSSTANVSRNVSAAPPARRGASRRHIATY